MEICDFEVGPRAPLFLIAGPDSLESGQMAVDTAGALREMTREFGINYIFKGSFDKANRTSHKSYRGPGLSEGMRILNAVKTQVGVPVLTDVHDDTPVREVAAVVDVIQTPAFLCRQTNFLQNVARQGCPVNVKKGQFMSPWEMDNVVAKLRD